MHVIGIIGKINTGKDTAASICKKNGYVRKAFADPIKEIVHELFDVPREVLWGDSQCRTEKVRKMLQLLGTDYARAIDPDVWVKKMKKQLQRCRDLRYHGVVIPDVRFVNEAEMLKEENATLLRIVRPKKQHNRAPEVNCHISEKENLLIPEKWITHTIINNGTVEDLECSVMMFLQGVS